MTRRPDRDDSSQRPPEPLLVRPRVDQGARDRPVVERLLQTDASTRIRGSLRGDRWALPARFHRADIEPRFRYLWDWPSHPISPASSRHLHTVRFKLGALASPPASSHGAPNWERWRRRHLFLPCHSTLPDPPYPPCAFQARSLRPRARREAASTLLSPDIQRLMR